MDNKNIGFNNFINEKMFATLSGCIAIVCALVQITKGIAPFNPWILNFIFSALVACIRIAILKETTWRDMLLGLLQIIPIMLGASGTYEIIKTVTGG